MSEAVAPAPVAPSAPVVAESVRPNGKTGPIVEVKPQLVKPVEPEVAEEYEMDGKKVYLTKTQVRTHFQKYGAVDKRFQQVTEKEKELRIRLEEFEKDPEAAYARSGKDPIKVIQEMLARNAKLQSMTDEQRELFKLQTERDQLRSKLEAEEVAKAKAKEAEVDARTLETVTAHMLAAAESKGLDRTPETLDLMCVVAQEALELEYPLTYNQLADEVVRRQTEHVSDRDRKILAKMSDDEKLLKYLGPDVVKRVQKASLAAIPVPSAKPKASVTKLPPRNEGGRFLREVDFDKKFGFRR